MSKSSQTIDPAHRRLYEEVVNKKADLQRQLQLSLSSLFLDILQSTEVELARCKDYQRKETLLRELVAEIEEFKRECDKYLVKTLVHSAEGLSSRSTLILF
ncbi:hypothetical protein ARMGADRAFT_1015574 [Armillaria gallica]|uniref:Uncharacterized protein n=1 Tax=Armillaria gallica TaxID=47427 RepID=A0A2H3D2E0_ARMGA|nr:hypothetical protein ARMGADRAFT_1015574 [Armillaria gallica]